MEFLGNRDEFSALSYFFNEKNRDQEIEISTNVRENSMSQTPPANTAPFDYDTMLNRCAGQPALLERAIAAFSSELEGDLQALADACNSEDAEQIAQAAHRIKGVSANISADRLSQAASDLEKGSEGSPSEVAELWKHVQSEAKTLTDYLADRSFV